jgi:glucose uptake protein
MVIVHSYPLAVLMCVVTMLSWGSWTNTQKLASRSWPFQLFYWDYAFGLLLFTLIFAFTFGSFGSLGRHFTDDIAQASGSALRTAFLGGVVFNLANILVVSAIDIAGMAVAFPVGIGIALVVGVIANYIASPIGNPVYLFTGVGFVVLAIVVNALAYRRLPAEGRKTPVKALVLSVVGGVFMGLFYRFVTASMAANFIHPESGLVTPYTAIVLFALGVVASNVVFNTYIMARPFSGEPASYGDYFMKGGIRQHLIGLLGGAIWGVGISFSLLASGVAGYAISYGLGQGSVMVGAIWGVFVWKEFRDAPPGTTRYLDIMFASFIAGLTLIIVARVM